LATASPTPPRATVVMPTYARRHLLPEALDALLAQPLAGGFELVVVDDEAQPATRELVEARAAAVDPGGPSLRYLATSGRRGPAHARNLGWRAGRGEVVAFIDDDCLAQPGWLAALVGEVEAGADLVQGRVRPNPHQADRGAPFTRTLDVGASPFFETANIAYRRAVLEELDGFDESFPLAAGEDTDLGHRAVAGGAVRGYAEGAEVWHEVHPMTFAEALRNAARCDQLIRVVRRYPDLGRFFRTDLLLLPHHPLSIGAAAGAGLALAGAVRRSPVLVAGGALAARPWLRLRLRTQPTVRPKAMRVATLPLQLAVELAELGYVLRAAVRYRDEAPGTTG
jgi:glycosyltransferase involved in cell wall biosynthesis